MTKEAYRNTQLEEKFLRASNHLISVVILLAAIVLLGWQFDIEFLKRPLPNWVAMNPVTAVAFISLSAALLLLKRQNVPTRSGLGYVLSIFVLLVGLIRLTGVLTSFDLHVDEFLYPQKVATTLTNLVTNRMAPNTAFCFVIMAVTVLVFRSVNYRWRIIAQLFCLGVALLALFAIIGYSYQVQEFYRVSNYIPMSIQTAVGFLLLSLAILFAVPSEGFMAEFTSSLNGSKVTRNIIPLAIILPSILGFVRLLAEQKGLLPLELGSVALILSMILVFLALVYFSARQLNANDRERLKVEQQLFNKNEWFNQTLVSLGDGVITTDSNGVITLLNRAAVELTGWQAKEAVGKHIDYVFTITNERTGQKVINPVMEALQQNRVVLLANHTILTRKNGSQLYIDDSGAPIHNDAGEIIGAVLIFRDITDKKKADDEIRILNQTLEKRVEERTAELLKTEQQLSRTLDNMMEGALLVGFDWKINYTNDAWLKHAKYTRKEVIGFTLMEIFPGYEQTEFYKMQEKCMRERVSVHLENEFTFPDGSAGWFQVTAQPSPEGIFIMTADITAHKKAELALKESEAFNRGVLASLSSQIAVINKEGIIIAVNKAWDDFAKENGGIVFDRSGKDTNYFDVCKKAAKNGDYVAKQALDGIFEVVHKKRKVFELQYPCHSPDEKRWFLLRVMNFENDEPHVVLAHQNITEIILAQEKLQKSQQNYQRVVENINDGLMVDDLSGKVLYANNRFIELFGLTQDDLPNLILEDYVAPEYRSMLRSRHNSRVAGEKVPEIFEYEGLRKDGSKRWFEVRVSSVIENGKIAGTQSAIRDITERKIAEIEIKELYESLEIKVKERTAELEHANKELQASLKETKDYKYALDNAAIVAITDSKGTIIHVNEMLCKISKYSREELLGQNFHLLNSGYHTKQFFKQMWLTITNGRMWQGEVKNRAKDGSYYWVDTTIIPFLTEEGKPYQYLAIRYEITARKTAEEGMLELNAELEQRVIERTREIVATKEYYKGLIENSSDAVILIDQSGNLIYQSPAVERIGGYTVEETLGKSAGLYMHPDDSANFGEMVMELYGKPGESLTKQYRVQHKLGHWLWVEGTITNRLHDQNIKAFIANYRDITDRKKAEDEIFTLNDSLEIKVKERTAELQEANRELETFSYTVSHDLQSPLRSLSGFSKILLKEYKDKLGEEGGELLSIIDNNAKRMSNLISDLLAFSKLGKAELHKKEVDLNEIISVAIDEIKFATTNFNVEIKLHPLANVHCDPALTKQVWVNLIGNAVKYSSKKEKPVVEIGVKHINNQPVYFVKDNGDGFDMKFADKLFTVFQRLHNTDEFEGTGVGLATVERIITKHGGRIWAEGKKMEGATFYFTLST